MPIEPSPVIRQEVALRAGFCCEYCLLPESFALHKHEADHIVSLQHGGETCLENLAYVCMRCNRLKGPNVGSYDPLSGELVPFFNPRVQKWSDHFRLEGALIRPLTPEARATARILRFNQEERVAERERIVALGLLVIRDGSG